MARKNPRLGPSDSSGTYFDRLTVGKIPHAKAEGADRGLDQAEEAQPGTTDEELAKKPKP